MPVRLVLLFGMSTALQIFRLRHTTIYWGYTASPSALTMQDSPEAVGYPYRAEDYTHGTFRLPESFDLSINFKIPGKVFLRAYAKVGDNHLLDRGKNPL